MSAEPETPTIRADTPPAGPAGAPGTAAPGERYVIEAELGRGGMGVVYRAFDRDLKRLVALKVTLGDGGDRGGSARFVEEAQAAARLEHPGIVPVYDVGRDARGRLFFAMKLVEGRTLAQERDHLSPFRRVQVLTEVCRAVAYAHDRGLIHRDLKPQNVMLGVHGEVQVMDWGLAKSVAAAAPGAPAAEAAGAPAHSLLVESGERDVTRAGAIVGTPGYMAPEQASGSAGAVGPAADIYALGGTLFHVLTGRPPVEGDSTAEILTRLFEDAPRDPRALDPGVPAALAAICVRALAKRPGDRYPTASAFADDLQAYLEHRRVSAYEEPWIERAAKWARRNKGLVRTGAAVLLAIVVGAVATARRERASFETGLRTRTEAARQRLGAGGASLDERLGFALDGLQAASHLAVVSPDATNRRLAFDAAMVLADLAMKAEQWGLATATLEKALALDVDDAAARARLADAERGRTRVQEEHRRAVEGVIADARSGKILAMPEGYDDALFTLVTYREPQTVSLLADALDGVTAALHAATRTAVPLAEEDAVLARLCCDALGRIGDRERGGPALARYLRAETDDPRASAAGVALARIGGAEAYMAISDAGYRLGYLATFGTRTMRALRGSDFGSHFDPSTSKGRIARADAHLKTGNLEAALADARGAVEIAPRDPESWALLGDVLLKRMEPDAALHAFSRAVALAPADPGYLRSQAAALDEVGRVPEALASADRAIALAPDDGASWHLRGTIHLAHGDWRAALEDFDRAIALQPGDADAFATRAQTRYILKDHQGAIEDATRALSLDPYSAEAYNYRGCSRGRLGQLTDALADHDRAIALAPGDADVWFGRAATRREAGDWRGVVSDLDRAARLSESPKPDIHLYRGDARLELGDLPAAIEDYGAAIRLAPGNPKNWLSRAFARTRAGELEGALADVEEGLKLAPKLARARALRAEILRRRGDLAGARAEAERSLKLDPDLAAGHAEMAHLHLAASDLEAAFASADRAVRAGPDDPAALAAMVLVARARGDDTLARDALEELIATDPLHPLSVAERK